VANPALDKQSGDLPDVTAQTEAQLNLQQMSLIVSETEVMTIGGTSAKTGFPLLLVLGADAWGWHLGRRRN
jgi:hypothetical protein